MASKTITANYSPAFRAVPSLASSWSSFSEQVHRLHNDTSLGTDRQNMATRQAMLDAFAAVGGEDAALNGNKLVTGSFNTSATAITVFVNLT